MLQQLYLRLVNILIGKFMHEYLCTLYKSVYFYYFNNFLSYVINELDYLNALWKLCEK